jgi:hypothetical protein
VYEAHKGNYGHYYIFYLKSGRNMLTYRGVLYHHLHVEILATEFQAEGEIYSEMSCVATTLEGVTFQRKEIYRCLVYS